MWENMQNPTIYHPCLGQREISLPWLSDDVKGFKANYVRQVEEYSRWMLTLESDGLAAFEGILSAWKKQDQPFLWALPGSIIQYPFPSWSWVGWGRYQLISGRLTYLKFWSSTAKLHVQYEVDYGVFSHLLFISLP